MLINVYLIRVSLEKELSLLEFIVLVHLYNNYNMNFDVDEMAKMLGISTNDAMKAFNSLMVKELVSLESVKDVESRYKEVINLDGTYDLISQIVLEEDKKAVNVDIYKQFETELGRTLSSRELEIINGWVMSGTPEELIVGALNEALYNGVSHFRYIDKIIFEWEKKGFKTMNDVKAYLKNRNDKNNEKKVVSKKEEDILAYDWLSNDDN